MTDLQATLDAMAADGSDALEKARVRRKLFLAICEEYPFLKFLCSPHGNEPRPPAPLDRDQFAAVVGTLWTEPYRTVLQELLIELLRGAIKTLARDEAERVLDERQPLPDPRQEEWHGGDDWPLGTDEEAGGRRESGTEAPDPAAGH